MNRPMMQQPRIRSNAYVIANKIKEKYAELCKAKGLGSGTAVVGFVITFGLAPGTAHVVSQASGTKCISSGSKNQS